VVAAVITLLSLIATTATAQKINLPPVKRVTLENGIRVVLMEYRKAPTLSVTALFPGGSAADAPGKVGTASFAADLMRKGTATRTGPQIAEQIEFLGGSLSAGASSDRVAVGLNLMAKDTDAGLDLFADVLRNPTFPAEEMERDRQLTIAGLESLRESAEEVADRLEEEIAYPDHPYGAQMTVTSVKAVTREDVTAYYRRFIAPNRMILVAVGDFKADEMLAKLRTRFADWPRSDAEPFTVQKPNPAGRSIVLVDKPDATQTQVRLVRSAFPRSHPDYFAALVANSILGGGFTSRLTDEIRVNRSLTYGISSAFGPLVAGGTFGVSTFTKLETTRALIDAVSDVLRKAQTKGFTPAEVTKVKGYMAGLFAIRMQTPGAIAGQLADIAFFGLPADYLQTYIQRVQAITPADVNRIAKEYLAPEKLSIVMVTSAAKVRDQLKGLPGIQTRRVEEIGK
jgi:zinc protease